MKRELITIVDADDNVIGAEDRHLARQKGLIHRIVRVIIINDDGHLLIQQRSALKEDGPLEWEWSATGHVDAGEEYLQAAQRETHEEVSITDAELAFTGKYYDEHMKGELVIRRFNAVFLGRTKQIAAADLQEVAQIRWISPAELTAWAAASPDDFTRNFTEVLNRFGSQILGVDHSRSN